MSLSLVVEESDVTVVTASDEGWGSGRVGETMDGGQVTCTQENKSSSVLYMFRKPTYQNNYSKFDVGKS